MKGLAIFQILSLAALTHSQFFDSEVDDKTYLDQIEQDISTQVDNSAAELLERTKIAEKITKSYIAAKLKVNVFKVSLFSFLI